MNSRTGKFVPIVISEGAQAQARSSGVWQPTRSQSPDSARGMEAMTEPINFNTDAHEDQIASMIRPLPENVVPSERFLHQMRERLLQLEAAPRRPAKRAA